VTGPDGLFRITVPLGADYEVVAFDFTGDYDPQGYDHVSLSGCACADPDPVTVDSAWGTGPVPNIDFDLRRYTDWTWVSVLTQKPGAIAYPGVLVHLDRYDAGTDTWTLDVDTALSDASGFADLYGLGSADYRLRYSIGGTFTTVLVAEDPSHVPYTTSDGGKAVDLPGLTAGAGCGCGSGFDETDVDLTFAAPSGGSGSGGPTTPRTPHHSVTSFVGVVTTSSTPTPTPSATPSPTPSATPTGPSLSTPKPVSPAPASTGFDLTWLWILIAAALALIVVVFVVMYRRRNR
jgi:hypothetical protein